MDVVLQGKTDYLPLHEILQLLEQNRKTCVVTLGERGADSSLFLDNGQIIYATSQNKDFRLGEFIVNAGTMSKPAILKALGDSNKSGKLFTRHLIESGLVSLPILTVIFGQLVDSILSEAFANRDSVFVVTTPVPDIVLSGPIRLDIGRMTFDSLRKINMKGDSLAKINERIANDDFQIPPLPDVLIQLMSLLQDEEVSFQEIAKIIMTDQVLASGILKVANSPLYAAAGEIDSIHLAIARLGMKEIKNIITAIKIRSIGMPDVPEDRLHEILDNALKSGFMAGGLARPCKMDPEEAFLGGLLHDLGKTVILSLAGSCSIDEGLLEEFIAERHAEIGAHIAREWHYPESIQKLIRCHHDYNDAGNLDRMIAIIQITDRVIQYGDAWEGDQEVMKALNLDQASVLHIYRQALESFQQIDIGRSSKG